MTTVATFSDLDKAEGVKNKLESMGVHAEVVDESKYQRFLFLSKPLAGEKVYVKEEDFEKARQALHIADEQEHILQGEVRCPQCGSARIDYPQFTRKFITTTLVEIFCVLHLVDKQFFCEDCQHTWPVSDTLRPVNDVMGWPKKDDGMVKKEKV